MDACRLFTCAYHAQLTFVTQFPSRLPHQISPFATPNFPHICHTNFPSHLPHQISLTFVPRVMSLHFSLDKNKDGSIDYHEFADELGVHIQHVSSKGMTTVMKSDYTPINERFVQLTSDRIS